MYKRKKFGKICLCGVLVVVAIMTVSCSSGLEGIAEMLVEEPDPYDPGIQIEIVSSSEEETQLEESSEEEEKVTAEETSEALPPIEPPRFYPGDIIEAEHVLTVDVDKFFIISPISDPVFKRMDGNSYRPGCPVPREELRYLRILHYDFSGNIRVGELVCHQSVSEDLLRIFRQLYDIGYPVEKVRLVDDYGADDDRSCSDNNTSCFNYRTVAGTKRLSLHALGLAVDINPIYNPYVIWRSDGTSVCVPAEGEAYMDRKKDFPYKIDEEDICCRLFREAGFTWGGGWEGHKDYMHFSKGVRPER